jgi:membrane associated rhomboid family serine protease
MFHIFRSKIQPNHLLYTIFALLVAACNLHLLRGVAPSTFTFQINNVIAGEYYRLLTHPLSHASWYHLALDGLCMILLYRTAKATTWQKLIALPICATSSLLYSLYQSPHIGSTGYCGLSGIAHGFMFLVGWLWLFSTGDKETPEWHPERLLGLLFCLISLGKSLWEVHTGQILFADNHTKYLGGVPIVHSHLGGVIGGLFTVLLFQIQRILARHKVSI